jgi:large subunit ribosomal protein L21e
MAQLMKRIRQKGKIKLSEYFKELKIGDSVAVVNEASVPSSFPQRIVGRTGKIVGLRGRSKIIEMKDGSIKKQFIVHPIHLKRLK